MRPLSSLVLIFAALLLAGLQCGARRHAAPAREVGVLKTTHFGPWKKDETTYVSYPKRYEVRQATGRPGELLFTVKVESFEEETMRDWRESAPGGQYAVFSRDRYAVSLEDGRTRPATAEEWERAARVLHSRHLIPRNASLLAEYKLPPAPSTHDEAGVIFRAKRYAKTGASWGDTVGTVSPGEKWVAVFSYTSKEPPPPSPLTIPGFSGRAEAGNGDLFMDVYDVASGEKVLAGSDAFADHVPSMHFSDALWVEDRYLILPTNLTLETCLIGVMPAK